MRQDDSNTTDLLTKNPAIKYDGVLNCYEKLTAMSFTYEVSLPDATPTPLDLEAKPSAQFEEGIISFNEVTTGA